MFLVSSSWAIDFCGVHPNDTETQSIFEYRNQLRQIEISNFSLGTRQNTLVTIPVKAHIIDDGTGVNKYDVQILLKQLCELNELYAQVGMYFYLIPDINFVVDSRYIFTTASTDDTEKLLGELLFHYYQPNALNIYYTLGTGVCGMAPFPSWSTRYEGRTGVLMEANKQCAGAGTKTLAHELGHHFDLLHTFQGADLKNPLYHEYVTREQGIRNCESAGDGFCDTPADILDYSCPYTGSAKDLRGAFYNPDVSLLMSYHKDVCQYRFSDEEIAHMREVLYNDPYRKVYLDNQIADFDGIDSTQLISPIGKDAVVPYGEKFKFQWTAVNGADAYLFKIANIADKVYFQSIVKNAEFVEYEFPAKEVGRTYQWSVIPIKFHQPCSVSPTANRFKVTTPTAIGNHQEQSLNFYPNPISAKSILTINLPSVLQSNGSPIVVKILSLNGQVLKEETLSAPSSILSLKLDESLAAGTYILQLSTKLQIFQSKMMVIGE